jgi:hypothetical protein
MNSKQLDLLCYYVDANDNIGVYLLQFDCRRPLISILANVHLTCLATFVWCPKTAPTVVINSFKIIYVDVLEHFI